MDQVGLDRAVSRYPDVSDRASGAAEHMGGDSRLSIQRSAAAFPLDPDGVSRCELRIVHQFARGCDLACRFNLTGQQLLLTSPLPVGCRGVGEACIPPTYLPNAHVVRISCSGTVYVHSELHQRVRGWSWGLVVR